ncbi:MAG: GNAT family N-acetyltransferase [Nanoarchaeota archaeon]|nr:GNAT family N-acetyltransferase [Nanoarchaeota archaeon]
MDNRIRIADKSDMRGIFEIITCLHLGSYIWDVEKLIKSHLNPIDNYSPRCLVSENEGKLLTGAMLLKYNDGNFVLEINELAVRQNFRENGIGRILVDSAYDLALNSNCKLLELKSSLRFNVSDFYLHLGFVRSGPLVDELNCDEYYYFCKKVE